MGLGAARAGTGTGRVGQHFAQAVLFSFRQPLERRRVNSNESESKVALAWVGRPVDRSVRGKW